MNSINLDRLPGLLDRLYSVVADLETLIPRPFTPDGHLVGSIGEAVAAYAYGLKLHQLSQKAHDAETTGGIKVQIKLTQRNKVVLSYDCEHLIVLHLDPKIGFTEIYNGPGSPVWALIKDKDDEGRQRPITLSRLKRLVKEFPAEEKKVVQIRPFPVLSKKAREAVAN